MRQFITQAKQNPQTSWLGEVSNIPLQQSISFVCEVEVAGLPVSPNLVGVDLGIKTFATLNTGEKIDAPKPLLLAALFVKWAINR